jgi:hypothetical protein
VALASHREQKRRSRSVEAELGGDGSRELGLALAYQLVQRRGKAEGFWIGLAEQRESGSREIKWVSAALAVMSGMSRPLNPKETKCSRHAH